MAKWGEGDPRWLVEDRPDATNVNNWHWTEKNASQWSKDKFKELLVGLKIENEQSNCKITEMTKCEGEATVNNRKAKLIFFYEWAIMLKWKGHLKQEQEAVTGNFEILNLSEEHELKDVDVSVTVDKTGPTSEILKEMMRNKGAECVKKQLACYLKHLKEEFSKGLILPTKDPTEPTVGMIQQINLQKEKIKDLNVKSSVKNKPFGTGDLLTEETFKCRADEFYRVLTTKELIQVFSQGECVVEPEIGGRFELYGGNVQGYFTDLIPNKLIQQKWRFKSWPEGVFSDVKIEINETSDSTEVKIHQTGIPNTELDYTREGWKRYYWQSIKRLFGFGATLL